MLESGGGGGGVGGGAAALLTFDSHQPHRRPFAQWRNVWEAGATEVALPHKGSTSCSDVLQLLYNSSATTMRRASTGMATLSAVPATATDAVATASAPAAAAAAGTAASVEHVASQEKQAGLESAELTSCRACPTAFDVLSSSLLAACLQCAQRRRGPAGAGGLAISACVLT